MENNENLINDMNNQIKELGKTNINIIDFWQNTIDIIKDTMIEASTVKNQAKILRIWSAGVIEIEKEFGMDKTEKIEKIFKLTSDFINDKKLEENMETLDKFYANLIEIEWRTDEILEYINKNKHDNPLLALPAIRKAPPLKKEMIYSLKPSEIYLSAIKLIILKNNEIKPIEADQKVCLLLKNYNLPKNRILEAMLASPNISHLSFKEKREVIIQEINNTFQENKTNYNVK